MISGVPHFFMGLLETGNHKALHEGGATSLRIILLIENHSCKFLKSLPSASTAFYFAPNTIRRSSA
jgi:hypothetical protein